MQNRKLKPPFVKNVIHEDYASVEIPFIVSLEADWPTPSWDHENTEIIFERDKKKVMISYLGDRRPGVALQALKSFQVQFEINFPEKGEWLLVIQGKSENWEGSVIVE